MDPMKRVRLAVLFLVGAVLLTGTTALAATTVELTPTDVEPDASGLAKMTAVTMAKKGEEPGTASGTLTVTCQGLTPNSPYRVTGSRFVGGIFDTNSDGLLYAQLRVHFLPAEPLLIVVGNADGAVVLYGELVYQDKKK